MILISELDDTPTGEFVVKVQSIPPTAAGSATESDTSVAWPEEGTSEVSMLIVKPDEEEKEQPFAKREKTAPFGMPRPSLAKKK